MSEPGRGRRGRSPGRGRLGFSQAREVGQLLDRVAEERVGGPGWPAPARAGPRRPGATNLDGITYLSSNTRKLRP